VAKWIDRDLIAWVGAGLFALVALWIPRLERLCSVEVAAVFAAIAFRFWLKAKAIPEKYIPDEGDTDVEMRLPPQDRGVP
jgi:hypothetical protein